MAHLSFNLYKPGREDSLFSLTFFPFHPTRKRRPALLLRSQTNIHPGLNPAQGHRRLPRVVEMTDATVG